MSELSSLLEQGLALLRTAGPAYYFLAMTLLPALGVPMLAFLLPAVPLFAGKLGVAGVLALALASITANMAITWALARRGLRPPLARLMTRLGYRMPEVQAGDVTDLIIILRVTPGIPFGVQNYLAGLADAPFGKYMLVSCAVVWPMSVAFMLLGDSVLQGNGRIAALMLGLLAMLLVVRVLIRKRYGAKQPPA